MAPRKGFPRAAVAAEPEDDESALNPPGEGIVAPIFRDCNPPVLVKQILKVRVQTVVTEGKYKHMGKEVDWEKLANDTDSDLFVINPSVTTLVDLSNVLPPGEYWIDALRRDLPYIGAPIKDSRVPLVVVADPDDEEDEESADPVAPAPAPYGMLPGMMPGMMPPPYGSNAADTVSLMEKMFATQMTTAQQYQRDILALAQGNRSQSDPVVDELRRQIDELRVKHREESRHYQDRLDEVRSEAKRTQDRLSDELLETKRRLNSEIDEMRARYTRQQDDDRARWTDERKRLERDLEERMGRSTQHTHRLESEIQNDRARYEAELHRLQKENLGLLKESIQSSGGVEEKENLVEKYGPLAVGLLSGAGDFISKMRPPEPPPQAQVIYQAAPQPQVVYSPAAQPQVVYPAPPEVSTPVVAPLPPMPPPAYAPAVAAPVSAPPPAPRPQPAPITPLAPPLEADAVAVAPSRPPAPSVPRIARPLLIKAVAPGPSPDPAPSSAA